jgi:hypothetical protein
LFILATGRRKKVSNRVVLNMHRNPLKHLILTKLRAGQSEHFPRRGKMGSVGGVVGARYGFKKGEYNRSV